MILKNDLTIVVMAYDSYSDVWPGFVKCKQKYWKDCQYETVMINCDTAIENLNENVSGGFNRVICAGTGLEWTERLHIGLKEIKSPYVLLWLEDLFLSQEFSNEVVERYIDILKMHEEVGHIRICKDLQYQKEYPEDDTLGEILPGHAYRVSTHPAIWKTEYLMKLTEEPMDAWNFEYQKGFSCDEYNLKSLIVKEEVFRFTNMVWRAKWTKEAVRLDKLEQLDIDYSKRKKHSLWSNIITSVNTMIYKFVGADRITRLVMKRRKMGKGIPNA